MAKKRALILINNTAGTGHAHGDTFDIIESYAKEGYEPIVYPIIPGTELTSEKIIEKYKDCVDVIMCEGGDGTLNHVIASVLSLESDDRPPIAYLPSGSTNDFARCLGISDIREEAIRAAVSGKKFAFDVGMAGDRYFNYVAAFGAFSEISYDTDQALKNVFGYAAYVINAVTKLPQNIKYSCGMKIEYDGEEEEGEYVFGAVSNSISVGGMKLFGKAGGRLNDGKMELLLIRTPKNLSDINGILSALAGGNVEHPNISFRQVSGVSFHSRRKVSWTLDGEYGGESRDLDIKILKKAIAIRV